MLSGSTKQKDDDSRIRVCLVGLGWFQQTAHIPALLNARCAELASIRAVCCRDDAHRATSAGKLDSQLFLGEQRDVARYASLDALLADASDADSSDAVDAVVIALPIDRQPAAIDAALAAGRLHILSEKPIAPTLSAALGLWRAYAARCAAAAVRRAPPPVWAVLENWQCKPAAAHIVRLVRRGVIGRVGSFALCRFVDARADGRGGPPSWRNDAARYPGWLVDVGVHYARLLRNLFGELRRAGATAEAGSRAAQRVHGWLEFERGARGTLALAWDCAAQRSGRDPDLTLWGDAGTLRWYIGSNRVTVASTVVGAVERDASAAPAPAAAAIATTTTTTTPAAGQGRRKRGRRGGVKTTTKGFEGDKWISGGVEETLLLALTAVRRSSRSGCSDDPAALALAPPFELDPREALRDLAFVDALARSIDGEGRATVPWPRAAACIGPTLSASHRRLLTPRRVALALPLPLGVTALDPMALLSADDVAAARPPLRRVAVADALPRNALLLARSVDDVKGAVGWCAAHGCGVRALGARHSLGWSARGYRGVEGRATLLLDTRGLDAPFALHPATRERPFATVTVAAGTMLRDLVSWLHAEHRLTLPSLPVLLDQTAGGGVATGTHGSSLRYGTLSDAVVALTLVTGRRRVVEGGGAGTGEESDDEGVETLRLSEFDEEETEAVEAEGGSVRAAAAAARRRETLRAARCSVGALGVVASLTLKLVPAYRVRRVVIAVPLAQFVRPSSHLPLLREGCAHAWVKWRVGALFVGVCRLEVVGNGGDADANDDNDDDGGDDDAASARYYSGKNWFPFDAPRSDGSFAFDCCTEEADATDAKAEAGAAAAGKEEVQSAGEALPSSPLASALPIPTPPPGALSAVSMQYSVPLHRLGAALSAVSDAAPELTTADGGDGASAASAPTIEIKLLRSSSRTYIAANSVDHARALAVGDSLVPGGRCAAADPAHVSAAEAQGGGGWACFNAWWLVAPERRDVALAPLEAAMRTLGGARPHFGKQHGLAPPPRPPSDGAAGGSGDGSGGGFGGGLSLEQFGGAWSLTQRSLFNAAVQRCDPLGVFASSS